MAKKQPAKNRRKSAKKNAKLKAKFTKARKRHTGNKKRKFA
jgi:hypothetical protein